MKWFAKKVNFIFVCLLISMFISCKQQHPNEKGHVEITSTNISLSTVSVFYMGSEKFELTNSGPVYLSLYPGSIDFQIDSGGGKQIALCKVFVEKNRITKLNLMLASGKQICKCSMESSKKESNLPTCTSRKSDL